MTETKPDIVIGGTYQHYKGNRYRVHGLAVHSETLEQMVYYECLYPNKLGQMWVRPVDIFLSQIEIQGESVRRFKFVAKDL